MGKDLLKKRNMERIIYIMPLFACLLFGSCEVQEREDVTQVGHTTMVCAIESLLLDSSERVWPEDARIGVYGSEQGDNEPFYLRKADSDLKEGEFYGPQVRGEKITAYYPYSEFYYGSADAFSVSLNPTQEHLGDDAVTSFLRNCPRAFAFMKNGVLRFEYPFGLVRFRVELVEKVEVNKIVLSTLSEPVAGSGKITSGGLIMEDDSPVRAVLECGNAASQDVDGNFVDFYMTVVPGVYQEITASFYLDGESKPLYCTATGFDVPRISAEDFVVASLIVKTTGPEGFVSEKVEFDEEEGAL